MKAYRRNEIEKMNEFTQNEIDNLKKLNNNPNIVKFLDCFKKEKNLYMVYEHCNGGTLEEYLQQDGPLDEEQAVDLFIQLVNGFRDIHAQLILHRDIKPSNILIQYQASGVSLIKIADFGFCKSITSSDHMT